MQNRERKYRAWDGSRMIYFSDFSIGIEHPKTKKTARQVNSPVKPYIFFKKDTFNGEVRFGNHQVMDWIPKQDSEGQDIYEGDIVKGCSFNGSYALGIVEFYKYGFVVVPIGAFLEGICELDKHHIQVIGNIHQNKDLLIQ